MKAAIAVAAIIAAIIFGPLITDAIRDDESSLDKSMRELNESMDRLEALD